VRDAVRADAFQRQPELSRFVESWDDDRDHSSETVSKIRRRIFNLVSEYVVVECASLLSSLPATGPVEHPVSEPVGVACL
jgi:hypothetical protein